MRGRGGRGCGLGNWVVDGAKIVLVQVVVKVSALGRACSGTWRHPSPPHHPHLPQRHKIIAAPDQTPKKTLEVCIGSSCLRRAEQQQPPPPSRARMLLCKYRIKASQACALLLHSHTSPQALPVSPRAGAPSVGLFCPPPERLSLRGLWGPPLQTTRRFLPPGVENLRELRSERKGEKWIRAGVHALASFAHAGGSWTHGGARLEWRLGGAG